MEISKISVDNFKAIAHADVFLGKVTILVGTNSSGKSSFLQAVHWACRCVANPAVQNNQSRSIAVAELDYFPTNAVRTVGHNQDLREGRGNQNESFVDVSIEFQTDDGEDPIVASIPIRRGRNEAVQIKLQGHYYLPRPAYQLLNSRTQPFSVYIPGLAGVALDEQKESLLPVIRRAASGDANVVFRNILYLISNSGEDRISLNILSNWVSKVLGPTKLKVEFREDRHFSIQASIQTGQMANQQWVPIELAGTGVLQVIQIFSYLVLFRPKLLLIDEPDAHLHPDRQENLVRVLEEAAEEFGAQVVLTTHSPNIVRAASSETKLIWFRDGSVEQAEENVRGKMGWGLLDKSVLLVTEDKNTRLLQSILNQWPEVARRTSIWPVSGVDYLPSGEGAQALKELTRMSRVVVHRDGDALTPAERQRIKDNIDRNGVELWFTEGSDIEAHFCTIEHLATIFDDADEAGQIVEQIMEDNRPDFDRTFNEKRLQINRRPTLYAQGAGTPSHEDAKAALQNDPVEIVKGKTLSKKLKTVLQDRGINGAKLFTVGGTEIAGSLRAALER